MEGKSYEKGDIIRDIKKIQRIIEHTLKTYTPPKWKNIKEMNNFLHKIYLPKLNQDKIKKKLHRPITPSKIEAINKSLST